MLHILRYTEQTANDRILLAMFAARKAVFVDLLKWDVPVRDGRYEIDQFDDAHACYLVLASSAGQHLASARLLPTTRPHILDSLYLDLCEAALPRDQATAEITRFCLDRSLSTAERRTARDTLICALVVHALQTGISRYSAIAEQGWLEQILSFGWRCQSLGPVRRVAGRNLGALTINIDEQTAEALACAGITSSARLDEHLLRAAA